MSNDIAKNALNLEGLSIKDKNEFKKALALSGPVVMQIANWIALSRKANPPEVNEIFEKETIDYLEHCLRKYSIVVPENWTMVEIVNALGRLGGGDVRKSRKVGWKVALRGWQRFIEFKELMEYMMKAMGMRELPPIKLKPDP